MRQIEAVADPGDLPGQALLAALAGLDQGQTDGLEEGFLRRCGDDQTAVSSSVTFLGFVDAAAFGVAMQAVAGDVPALAQDGGHEGLVEVRRPGADREAHAPLCRIVQDEEVAVDVVIRVDQLLVAGAVLVPDRPGRCGQQIWQLVLAQVLLPGLLVTEQTALQRAISGQADQFNVLDVRFPSTNAASDHQALEGRRQLLLQMDREEEGLGDLHH